MSEYEGMTTEDLRAENQKLWEQRLAIKAEQMKIVKILDKRQIQEDIARKLKRLSDPEKEELAQILGPEPVPSNVKFGVLGAAIKKIIQP